MIRYTAICDKKPVRLKLFVRGEWVEPLDRVFGCAHEAGLAAANIMQYTALLTMGGVSPPEVMPTLNDFRTELVEPPQPFDEVTVTTQACAELAKFRKHYK